MANAQHSISTAITLEGASDYKREIDAIDAKVKALLAEYKLLSAQWGENEKSIEALSEKQRVYQSLVDNLTKRLAAMRERSDEFAKTQQNNVAKQEALTQKTQAFSSAIETTKKWLEEDRQATEKLTAKKAELEEKLKSQIEKYGKYNSGLNFTKGAIEKVSDEIEKQSIKTQKHEVALQNLTKAYEADRSELAALPEIYKENEAIIGRHEEQIFKTESRLLSYQKELATTTDELNRVKNGEVVLTEEEKRQAEAALRAAEAAEKEQQALEALALEFVNRHIVEDFKALVNVLKECVAASWEFESSLTSVQKTSDFTKAELDKYAREVKQLAVTIPITTEELNRVGEAAGQLGVAKENIVAFTEVMAKMGVATNMSAEEASTKLAQIASITGMAADEYENLASTIVALGNNYATTESNITTFMQRIAGSASNVGITEAQMAGLATAVSSVGMQADAGGTAIQSLINKMQSAVETGDNLDAWAKIMGTDTAELTRLWKNDASAALLKFVQGLGKLDDGMVSALKSVGVGEQRLIRTVTNLANAEEKTQLLSRALETANVAWKENNALTIEAAKRFETSESKAVLLGNAVNNLKIEVGDNLSPAINNLMSGATGVVKGVNWLIEKVPMLTDILAGLTSALGVVAANTVVTSGAFEQWVKKMADAPWDRIFAPTALAVAALVGLATALFTVASREENAGLETKKFVSNLKGIREGAEDAIEALNQQNDAELALVATITELSAKEEKSVTDKAMLASAVSQLSEAMPELNLAYDETSDRLYDISTNATLAATDINTMAEAIARQRVEEEKIEALTQLYVNKIQLEQELKERQSELTAAEKEWTDALINGSDKSEEAESKVNMLRIAVETLKKELGITIDEINGNGGYTEATEDATEATEEASSKADDFKNKMQALQREFSATSQSAYENLRKEVAGAFDAVGEASKSSYSTIMDNLASQQSYYTNYADNLTNLNHRNIDGMSEMLQEMQNEGKLTADVCASMADMSDEELAQVIAAWNNVKEAQKATADGLARASTAYIDKVKEYKASLHSLEGEYNVYVDTVYRQYGSQSDPWVRHAQGLEYVPYDDYAALLHEGEMVLTKAEARAYRESHTKGQSITNNNNNRNYGGVTLNVYAGANQDVDALADEIMYRIDDATKRKEAVWA